MSQPGAERGERGGRVGGGLQHTRLQIEGSALVSLDSIRVYCTNMLGTFFHTKRTVPCRLHAVAAQRGCQS